MGTRSLIIIQDGEEEIAVIYRQSDGYPTGHGCEIMEILKDVCPLAYTNGIPRGAMENPKNKIANGMHCLTATLIAGLKKHIGNIYIYPAGTRGAWEDYIYLITPTDDRAGGMVNLEAFYVDENEK